MVDRKVQGGYVGPYGNRMVDRMGDRMVSLRKGGPYEDRMVDRMETLFCKLGFHTVSVRSSYGLASYGFHAVAIRFHTVGIRSPIRSTIRSSSTAHVPNATRGSNRMDTVWRPYMDRMKTTSLTLVITIVGQRFFATDRELGFFVDQTCWPMHKPQHPA